MMVTSSTYLQMLLLLRYDPSTSICDLIVCWKQLLIESLYHLQFQYGNPDVLCSPLVEAKKNGTDLVVSSVLFESRIKGENFQESKYVD